VIGNQHFFADNIVNSEESFAFGILTQLKKRSFLQHCCLLDIVMFSGEVFRTPHCCTQQITFGTNNHGEEMVAFMQLKI